MGLFQVTFPTIHSLKNCEIGAFVANKIAHISSFTLNRFNEFQSQEKKRQTYPLYCMYIIVISSAFYSFSIHSDIQNPKCENYINKIWIYSERICAKKFGNKSVERSI
ncbi:hypothetical protein RCL_jg11201.t1 [Rhizophagus clarus]|uniref:Uncharacterized protein n=1 Tax=Rhizophagus clarus TaxID=94130 RepID=A0A8H3MA99_9GLOM|nr:hypothetical protein RCL_jg11201.t1 [Rhizophagus clarus]